jgi:hypothetical protein
VQVQRRSGVKFKAIDCFFFSFCSFDRAQHPPGLKWDDTSSAFIWRERMQAKKITPAFDDDGLFFFFLFFSSPKVRV